MIKPRSESRTRRPVLAPLCQSHLIFGPPARPQTIDENPKAVRLPGILVRTLDGNRSHQLTILGTDAGPRHQLRRFVRHWVHSLFYRAIASYDGLAPTAPVRSGTLG